MIELMTHPGSSCEINLSTQTIVSIHWHGKNILARCSEACDDFQFEEWNLVNSASKWSDYILLICSNRWEWWQEKHNRRHLKIEKNAEKWITHVKTAWTYLEKNTIIIDLDRISFLRTGLREVDPLVLDPKLAIWTTSEGVHKATICQC